jgi:hypothetical protein
MRNRFLLLCCFVLLACSGTPRAETWRIRSNGSGDAPTIQAGIDSALAGDSVLVGHGDYSENIILENGVELLGGWDESFSSRDPAMHISTINGQLSGSVVTAIGPMDSTCVLDGFTIINGSGTEDPLNPGYYRGGGILIAGTGGHGPRILNNVIRNNDVPGGGGGICIHDSSPVVHRNVIAENMCSGFGAGILLANCPNGRITENIIRNNNAVGDGGGIRADGGAFLFEGNTVADNECGINGGGISLDHCAARIAGNTVSGNTAAAHGGGIFGYAVSCIVEFNVIHNNTGGSGGGCLFSAIPEPHLRSNTIVENHSNEHGQISLGEGCSPVIENNIVAKEGNGYGIYCAPGSSPTFSCNDVWDNALGNYGGVCPDQTGVNGNISMDPQFCGIFNSGNYYLQSDSPCAPGNHPVGAECGLIGAYPVGCGPISTKSSTWGKIKQLR